MTKLWTKENFKCDRYCGECCKKTMVSLSKEDISRIKKLGYKEEYFLFRNYFNSKKDMLKKDKKGWCVFLKKDKNNRYSCKIHKNRPKTCREYPFFGKNPEPIKSCLPQDLYPNVFFSLSPKQNQ